MRCSINFSGTTVVMSNWVTLLTYMTFLYIYVTNFDVFVNTFKVTVLIAMPDVAFVVVDGHHCLVWTALPLKCWITSMEECQK